MHDGTAGKGPVRDHAADRPGAARGAREAPARLPGQRGGGPGNGGPEDGGPGGGADGRPRRARRWRVLRWLALGTAALVLGTTAAGWAYYQHLNHNIRKGQRSSGRTTVRRAVPNAAGQTPLNILLIGSDSRDTAADLALGGSRENAGGPARADVEMLLHVSADRRHAAVVSVPRDTRVAIPQCTDPTTGRTYPPVEDIINASLARGGPGCTLATWQNLTGVYVDHWMMVDFAGVVRMADAVGGVDVCVKENLWDHPTPAIPHGGSGLRLTAGVHRVTGEQALRWLRTRDAFGSDLGRAEAQHMYLASMLRELRSRDVLTDPARLTSLAETATESIEVSKEIGSVKTLYGLAEQLRSVPPDRVTMITMPNVPDPEDPEAHLLPDPRDAPRLWAMLRDDVPLDRADRADPATAAPGATPTPNAVPTPSGPPPRAAGRIPVTVDNGTAGDGGQPVPDRAGAITEALRSAGFTRAVTGVEEDAQASTTLVYPASLGARGRADATAVATALGIPAGAVRPSAGADGITLTVGADWTTGTDYASTVPSAGDLPADADALNGADSHACMDVYRPYRW